MNKENEQLSNEKPQKNKNVKLIYILVTLLLLSAAVFAGYYFGSKGNTPDSVNTNNTSGNSESDDVSEDTSDDSGITFVTDSAVPYDLKKRITVDLGIPDSTMAVQISSNNHNRGLEQFLTDKFNDEVGRWTLGYPDFQVSSDRQISILAIGDSWLEATQDVDGPFVIGADINTPEQKQAYLESQKSKTDSCIKDKSKGFITKGESINICYGVLKSKYGEDGVMTLNGYGVIGGRQIVLIGSVELRDTKSDTVDMWFNALSQTKVTLAQ